MPQKFFGSLSNVFEYGSDIWHNDIQDKDTHQNGLILDTQQNDTLHNGLICDTQHDHIQLNIK